MSLSAVRSICLSCALLQGLGTVWAQAQTAVSAQSGEVPADADEIELLRSAALAEGESGKTADAIRDYKHVLQVQANWKEGWWNLGMLEYGAGQFQEARSTFQRVAGFAPGLGVVWAVLGLCEYQTGDYDDALVHLRRADSLGIREDEEIARVAQYHLGLLLLRASDFEQAGAVIRRSFGAGAMPAQARIALGLAALRVPVLPEHLDPSMEALVAEAGDATASEDANRFAALLKTHPDLPYLRLALGRALETAGKSQDALEQFLAETKISPESPAPWIEISRLHARQGNLSESIEAAQKAIRLSPSDPEAHRALADAFDKSGRTGEAVNERQSASSFASNPPAAESRIVHLYSHAVDTAVSPGTGDELWKQALREYVAEDFGRAGVDLATWLAANPSSGTGWALLGLCEFKLGNYDGALIHLDRSAKLGLSASSESIDQARYTYGILLVRAGRFDDADTVLATAWHPSGELREKIEVALGLSLLRRPEFPEAAKPQERDLIAGAGRIAVLLEQSNYEEAFPQLNALLDRYPHAPFVHYAYGTALIAYSRFDEAARQMEAERTISPSSELPCLRLASIALRQQDAGPAVKYAHCALDLSHNSVEGHYLLGRASLEANDPTTAVHELEIAASLSPASPEIHFNLARAYAKAKMPEKAQMERDLFSRLNESQKAPAPNSSHE